MQGSLEAARDRLTPVIDRVLERNARVLEQLVAPAIQLDGVVAVLDVASPGLPFLRFAPYLVFPQAEYTVTLYNRGDGLAVSLGRNPWLKSGHVDLGAIARREGGGGHAYAAGVTFPNSQYGDPYSVARVNLLALVREVNRQHAKKAA